jgi:hypothetical protein
MSACEEKKTYKVSYVSIGNTSANKGAMMILDFNAYATS